MNIKNILCCLLMLAFFNQTINAQKEETSTKEASKGTRKMTIVTKTIDENGKETVTTVVKEGDEVTDEEIDKIMQEQTGKSKTINVEVDLEDEKTEKITIKEGDGEHVKKQYKIIKKNQAVETEKEGDGTVIFLDEDDNNNGETEIKIIKKKGDKDEIVWIEKKGEKKNEGEKKMLFITEDGDVHEMHDKDIKVIKKKEDGKEVEVEIDSDGGHEMIWIEKEGGEEGDIIIIEEETTEEEDENGKVIKKTVKKTKKIVKKGN